MTGSGDVRYNDVRALTEAVRGFARARDWERFHTPKNLAMALTGEAGELAAEFQWLTGPESAAVAQDPVKRAAIVGEIADVAIYLLRLADVLGVDLAAAVRGKLSQNEGRFPLPGRGGVAED